MPIEKQRALFLEANAALKKGHYRTFTRLSKKIKTYPLYGYLQYDYLRKRLNRVSERRVSDFITTYDDSPISSRMRQKLLHKLARKKQWKTFLTYYQKSRSTKLQCHNARALYQSGQIKKANKEAKLLWYVGKSQPSACDEVFRRWAKHGGMTRDDLWARVELAMNKGKISLVKFLAKRMNKSDRNWIARWQKMRRKPAENLARKIYQKDSVIANQIARYGVKRLARKDVEAAVLYWASVKARHIKKTPEAALDVDQYIALRAAYQNHPRALEWLSQISKPSKKVQEWRIRTALYQQDWWAAMHWIEALPEKSQGEDQWLYWRARIMSMQSDTVPSLAPDSDKIFLDLSNARNFYGFMAADRVGSEYALKSDPLKFSAKELLEVEKIPGVIRAKELFLLKRVTDARREWAKVTKKLDKRSLQKVSVLASQWGWHDRAIFTVAKSFHFGDLALRFPMAHKSVILSQAKKQGVDASWVYGVLRQESGFMADARSGAGALGLMQLMPSTGRSTAKALKLRIRSNRELLNVNKNIRLGSAYLRRMLDKNDGNRILATASYNAGPNRVRKWLPKNEMPADVWLETIPYNETRKYVKRVMAYSVIYDKKISGKASLMTSRMPVIKARPG